MAQNILVSVAWPYANADIHVGNITGAYLPADIFARYHRLAGNRVLMVSGSDAHGTPITVKADAEKTTSLEVFLRYHRRFLDLYVQAGLSYDLFTHTDTENHHKVSRDMFTCLLKNKYLQLGRQQMWYSESERRFLPDRYVEGECYICHYPHARGDQCDNCGNLLDATQLINPRSKGDGSRPVLRETEHFFLDLPRLGAWVREYLNTGKEHWRPNVINFARNQVAEGELLPRPITRDLDWGVPVPLEGWQGKCLYVWFEAVIGYLSASIEWAANQGTPEAWKDWWYQPDARAYYFIGKDNIPFHAVIWPAQLIGSGPMYPAGPAEAAAPYLNLPYDVPANEFMNMEGQKISGSRGWGVWGLDFLSRHDPDPLRYYLTANMPESRDSDWSWDEFVARNNNELVATWGNLANRILSFAFKNFERKVPGPGELRPADNEILAKIEGGFETVGGMLSAVKLRAALAETMALATEVNRYLDRQAPWFEIKTDREAAAKTVYTTLKAVDSLKVLFAPFLPFTSERLHGYLGYEGRLFGTQKIVTYPEATREHQALTYDPAGATGRWQPSALPGGQPLRQPAALFKKLDESVAEEERARLTRPA
jgi:methionyl-tRNA synthetase